MNPLLSCVNVSKVLACRRQLSAVRKIGSSITVLEILQNVQAQKLSPDSAAEMLSLLPPQNNASSSHDINLQSFANLDHERSKRTGFPEAVFAQGKSYDQIEKILDDMARHVNESIYEKNENVSTSILATR